MSKVILITGATDGIGLLTAQKMAAQGHQLIIHGRSADKLDLAKQSIESSAAKSVATYRADFSNLKEVEKLSTELLRDFNRLDVIINNAGVYKTSNPITSDNMDVRFVVNTLAPALLTCNLVTLLEKK